MPADEVEFLCMVFAIGEVELQPGGMERDLTGENRAEWQQLVMKFYFSRSIERQIGHIQQARDQLHLPSSTSHLSSPMKLFLSATRPH